MEEEVRHQEASSVMQAAIPWHLKAPSGRLRPCLAISSSRWPGPGPGPLHLPTLPNLARTCRASQPSRALLDPAWRQGQCLFWISGQVRILLKATLLRQQFEWFRRLWAPSTGAGETIYRSFLIVTWSGAHLCIMESDALPYDILDNSKIISEQSWKELKVRPPHYYPVETDLRWPSKLPHMVEWWTKAQDLLCQQKI